MNTQQLSGLASFSTSQKKIILDYEPPKIQILRYMGNKRALLQTWLVPELLKYIKNGETMLDLFAGTSSVGYALKPKVRILANDIQLYSQIISKALLTFNGNILVNEFEVHLSKNYKKNLKTLMKIYQYAIIEEERLLNSDSLAYFNFLNFIPTYGGHIIDNDKYNLLRYVNEKFISRKRNDTRRLPYILFSTYFSTNFFSLKQSIEIDSIRYAIDQIPDKTKKAVYLSCLLYAISKTVNSSGHFAEYINAHSSKTQDLIVENRNISVITQFLQKLNDFKNIYKQFNWKNKTYCNDYKKTISHLKESGELERIKLIYIDPPYTTAQYSRYYHIPETLIKYDYPEIMVDKRTNRFVKGKYRKDRHQSSFSQITLAEKSFNDMFELISSVSKATLAISYSDNSIIQPIEKLIDLAGRYYIVTNVKNGYIHSAQGSKFSVSGKGNHKIHEYLLVCSPR